MNLHTMPAMCLAVLLLSVGGCYLSSATPSNDEAGTTSIALCGAPEWTAVQAVLVSDCQGCHGRTPAAGAPMSLVTPGDLKAHGRDASSMNEAQLSVHRIAIGQMPPPPIHNVSSKASVLQKWIDNGYPEPVPCDAGPDGK